MGEGLIDDVTTHFATRAKENPMAGRVEGKVAVITGAAGGQGRAAAQLFAREGAKVVVSDVKTEMGHETVETITAAGGEAIFVARRFSWRPMWPM